MAKRTSFIILLTIVILSCKGKKPTEPEVLQYNEFLSTVDSFKSSGVLQ